MAWPLAYCDHPAPSLAAREAGNSLNSVMVAAASIVGPRRVERAQICTDALIELSAHAGLKDGSDEPFDTSRVDMSENSRALFLAIKDEAGHPRPEAMLVAVQARGGRSVFLGALPKRCVNVASPPGQLGLARGNPRSDDVSTHGAGWNACRNRNRRRLASAWRAQPTNPTRLG